MAEGHSECEHITTSLSSNNCTTTTRFWRVLAQLRLITSAAELCRVWFVCARCMLDMTYTFFWYGVTFPSSSSSCEAGISMFQMARVHYCTRIHNNKNFINLHTHTVCNMCTLVIAFGKFKKDAYFAVRRFCKHNAVFGWELRFKTNDVDRYTDDRCWQSIDLAARSTL